MGHLIANYHTHNKLCNHAVGEAKDYVEKAISLGMEEIGLTDHNPIPESFMPQEDYKENLCYRNMKLDEFYDIYLEEMEYVKSNYSNKITIKTGLECEFLPERIDFYKELKSHLDYLNLGVHYFKDEKGNIVNSYYDINSNNVMEYANACIKGMETGLFKILVHPDLFMFNYKNKNGLREFDEAAVEASKAILSKAEELGIYVEVNVNGLSNSRKYNSTSWLYPFHSFWLLAKNYPNLKIVIGIDAHNPDALDSDDIDSVMKFCTDLGLNIQNKVEF